MVEGKFENMYNIKPEGVTGQENNNTPNQSWYKNIGNAIKNGANWMWNNKAKLLGAAAYGTAAYHGGPEAVIATKKGLETIADVLPEGNIKNSFKKAAWINDTPKSEPKKVDLTEIVPGAEGYTQNLSKDSGGGYKNKSSYDPLFIHNPSVTGKYVHKNNRPYSKGHRRIKDFRDVARKKINDIVKAAEKPKTRKKKARRKNEEKNESKE